AGQLLVFPAGAIHEEARTTLQPALKPLVPGLHPRQIDEGPATARIADAVTDPGLGVSAGRAEGRHLRARGGGGPTKEPPIPAPRRGKPPHRGPGRHSTAQKDWRVRNSGLASRSAW